MSTTDATSKLGSGVRTTFGALLFVAWGLLSILWVYDAVHRLIKGEPASIIMAVGALALMMLLGGMEGLEVAVIDRWRQMYPDRTTSELAAWLAARQLFVALIVTAATQLAERDSIAIPGLSTEITGPITLKIFNLIWTTFTVLWFMQIFPKMLAATNPDRYLKFTQGTLFPIVEVVRKIGVSQPGEWTAAVAERRLDWHAEPTLEKTPRRGESLAGAWAALSPQRTPAAEPAPGDRTAGPAGT
jgi:hypothetical protein